MSNEQILTTAYRAGYEQALADVAQQLEAEPFFHQVEREVALESVDICRNPRRIATLAASSFAGGVETEVR